MSLAALPDDGLSRHVCHLYRSDEEYRSVLCLAARLGLQRRHQIILIGAPVHRPAVEACLHGSGIDVTALLAAGHIQWWEGPAPQSATAAAAANPYRAMLAAAQASGYAGLTWIEDKCQFDLQAPPHILAAHEAQLDELAGEPVYILCQYDRRCFTPALLADVVELHPTLIVDDELLDNPLAIAPQPAETEEAYQGQRLARALARLARDRQRHTQLLQEYHMLRTVVDNLPDYIYVKDLASRFVFNNRAHLQQFGAQSPEEVAGKSDFDFFPPELAAQYRADEQAVLATRTPLSAREEITVDAAGRRQWVLTTKLPLTGSQGEVIGLFGISRDISELKRAQGELEKRERQLSEAQRLTQIGSWEWEIATNTLHWSDEMYRIYGLELRTPLTYESFLSRIHPDDRAWVEQIVAQAGRDAQPFHFEHRIVRPGGTVRHLDAHGRVVTDAAGQAMVMYGTGQDITERKQLEAELLEVKRQLNEGREAERRHLARELHDMPVQELAAALMHLHDLQSRLAEPAQRTLAAAVQGNLQQANHMLRDLCNELRPPALEHFGVRAALRGYIEQFQANYPDLDVRLTLAPEDVALPPWAALALYRICQQALTNVVQHARARRVEVRMLETPDAIILEVEDDGRGFVVPERWVSLARQRHYGLLGALERAESIGAQLTVSSQPGHGTRLRVFLPQDASRTAPVSP
jgi:PAS domain S-box-containing protein